MPSAGSDTVDATGEVIYQDNGGCTIFRVVCDAESSNNALVNVSGVHTDGDFFPLAPGELADFRLNDLGIRRVFVKGDSGEASIRYGVISKSEH